MKRIPLFEARDDDKTVAKLKKELKQIEVKLSLLETPEVEVPKEKPVDPVLQKLFDRTTDKLAHIKKMNLLERGEDVSYSYAELFNLKKDIEARQSIFEKAYGEKADVPEEVNQFLKLVASMESNQNKESVNNETAE